MAVAILGFAAGLSRRDEMINLLLSRRRQQRMRLAQPDANVNIGDLNIATLQNIISYKPTDTESFLGIMNDQEQQNFVEKYYGWIFGKRVFNTGDKSDRAVFEGDHFTWRDPRNPEKRYERYRRDKLWIPLKGEGGKHKLILPQGLRKLNIQWQSTRHGSALAAVVLPEGLTSIGASAFENCTSLTEISLPKDLTSIGSSAFRNTSLTEITLPNNLTTIEPSTFSRCVSITKITLPNNVLHIQMFAFKGCTSLAEIINLPDSLIWIEEYAFDECTSLTKITLPSGMKEIHRAAFRMCTSLTKITLPNGLKSIGDDAFKNCTSLTTVTFLPPADDEEYNLPSIGKGAFSGCKAVRRALIFEN